LFKTKKTVQCWLKSHKTALMTSQHTLDPICYDNLMTAWHIPYIQSIGTHPS